VVDGDGGRRRGDRSSGGEMRGRARSRLFVTCSGFMA
jgi:hypothetical protein